MKIPQDEKEKIINGLMDLLDHEKTEMAEKMQKVDGRTLINFHGIYKTKDGQMVLPGKNYYLVLPTERKINHRQKLGHIIADAATMDEVETRLAEYLVKNAKDMEAVANSIPTNSLLIHKNKTSQNGN